MSEWEMGECVSDTGYAVGVGVLCESVGGFLGGDLCGE